MSKITQVTIKDVAREAKVSISTVSNALNNVNVLHPDTKRHILKVAKEMGYIPNQHGRNLKMNSTKVLGLFLRSIKGPYYGTLIDSIATECEEKGYDLNVFITKNEDATINSILGKGVDGAIILNEWIEGEHLELLEKANIPIVFLDREKVGEKISSVVFASYKGGQMIARYLISQGHKKIGYIHGVEDIYDDIERFKGLKDVLNENGLEFLEDNRLYGDFEEDISFSAVKTFLNSGKELPDAFFTANDLSAIGCIKALKSEGILVPDDVSVVGFDDIVISKYFNPKITTVGNPIERQGVLAVERLLDIIQNKGEGRLDKLEGSMVIRDSCQMNKKALK